MAVSPEEMLTEVVDEQVVDQADREVQEMLTQQIKSLKRQERERLRISIRPPGGFSQAVRNAVIERYEAKGWQIKEKEEQDGPFGQMSYTVWIFTRASEQVVQKTRFGYLLGTLANDDIAGC
jgi:hypothetical protein